MGMVFGGGTGGLRGGNSSGNQQSLSQFPLSAGINIFGFIGRLGTRAVQISGGPTTITINNIQVQLNITRESAGQTLLRIVQAGIPAHLDSFGILYIDVPITVLGGDIPTLQALGLA
jgi:hypothetical protein